MAPTGSPPQGASPDGGAAAQPSAAPRFPLPILTPRPPPPLPPADELGNLAAMSCETLKEMCREYELKVSGTKPQLIARLRQEPEPAGKAPKPLPVFPGGEHEPLDHNTAHMLSDFKAKDLDNALAALGEAPEKGDTVAHKRRRLEIAATVPSRAQAARKAIWAAVRLKHEAGAAEYEVKLRKELDDCMRALRVEYDCFDQEELWVHAEMHQKTVEGAARLARGEPAYPHSKDRKEDLDTMQFILRCQWDRIPRALLEALGLMQRLREEDHTAALRSCHEALADLSRTTAAVAALLGDDVIPAAVKEHHHESMSRFSESTKLERAFRSCVPSTLDRAQQPRAGVELATRKGVAAAAWTALALYAAGACADEALVRAIAADARRFGALRDAPAALTPERASELASAAAARLASKQYFTPLAELPFPFEESGRAKLNALLAAAGAEK